MQRARPFVFSTAPPPALADALDASLSLVDEEPDRRDRLQAAGARTCAQRLRATGIDRGATRLRTSSRSCIGDNDRAVAVASALQADGFDVRAIRPPTVPAGTARLRVSVNAGLSEADLIALRRVCASSSRHRRPMPAQVHARSCCAASS